MKKLIPLSVIFLTACATTYKPPILLNQIHTKATTKSSAETIKAAKRVLAMEGFQISSYDDEAGVISTTTKEFRILPEMADCGTTMGLNYLEDNRTDTGASINVIVSPNSVQVKANIEAEYKPGQVAHDLTLQCVSKGVIEKRLLDKITQ
jgi:hypothetical protein